MIEYEHFVMMHVTGVKLGHVKNALIGVLTIAMYTTPTSACLPRACATTKSQASDQTKTKTKHMSLVTFCVVSEPYNRTRPFCHLRTRRFAHAV